MLSPKPDRELNKRQKPEFEFKHKGFDYMLGGITNALFVKIGAEWHYINKTDSLRIMREYYEQ
jgi:hypothetical protein